MKNIELVAHDNKKKGLLTLVVRVVVAFLVLVLVSSLPPVLVVP
jgi:methylglyoxal synthase